MKRVKRFMIMIMTKSLLQSRLRMIAGFNNQDSACLFTTFPETAEKHMDMKGFIALLHVIYDATKTIFLVLAILAFYVILVMILVE